MKKLLLILLVLLPVVFFAILFCVLPSWFKLIPIILYVVFLCCYKVYINWLCKILNISIRKDN